MATAIKSQEHNHVVPFCHAVLSSSVQSHSRKIQQHKLVVMTHQNVAFMDMAATDAPALDTVHNCQKLIIQGPVYGWLPVKWLSLYVSLPFASLRGLPCLAVKKLCIVVYQPCKQSCFVLSRHLCKVPKHGPCTMWIRQAYIEAADVST